MGHHDEDSPQVDQRPPANLLGIDYRTPAARRIDCRIVDIHTHVHQSETVELFFESADIYQVDKIVSMTPLDQVAPLRERWADRLDFIAIPRWREMSSKAEFQHQWLDDLDAFAELGARRMKFWMAPPMRGEHSLTMMDAFFTPLIRKGLDLGFDFMIHVADPSAWFERDGRYADVQRYGTKRDQYLQLECLLETVAPRNVIAAHMAGNIEDPEFLALLLERYPNLYLDTSATKWVVRGVAKRPNAVRELIMLYPDRILFGSDIVVADRFDFDHYASRFWAQQMMWESDYRGDSPIADPDAGDPPQLAGLNLPDDVLHKLYHGNAEHLGY